MDDLRDQLDAMISGLGRMSEIAQLKDKQRIWQNTDRRECGNCDKWMKSRICPREKPSMTGYSQGPSCGTPACNEFELKGWVAELKEKRGVEIDSERQRLGLS